MTARRFLYVIAVLTLAMGLYQGYLDAGHVAENGVLLLIQNVVLAALLFGWCRAHVAERGVAEPRGASILVAIIFPLGLPYYAFRSMPWRSAAVLTAKGFALAVLLMFVFGAAAIGAQSMLEARDDRAVVEAESTPHPFPPQAPAPDHPILGTWTWLIEARHCTERYSFAADGSTRATSGEENAGGTFEVSAKPDADGFYAVRSIITASNGKVGCAGPATPPGTLMNLYVRVAPDRRSLGICFDRTGTRCLGPMLRES